MVLSVLQNKWLATNGSKRTTNWASNIDILQYNLVLPMFFVGRKVAFYRLGSIETLTNTAVNLLYFNIAAVIVFRNYFSFLQMIDHSL